MNDFVQLAFIKARKTRFNNQAIRIGMVTIGKTRIPLISGAGLKI